MDAKSKISVILPSRPEEDVSRAVEALRETGFPPDRLEILHVTGRHPSVQRNLAAREATGDVLYFLDNDAAPGAPSDFCPAGALATLAALFDGTAVSRLMAGGPSWTPPTDSPLQQAIGLVFASAVGGGAVRARYASVGKTRPAGQHELILCNLMMERASFLELGGFDERLYPNEENDLIVRFLKSGGRALYVPEAGVWRSQRSTLRAFTRQVFTYGRGRAEQTRVNPASLTFMAPAAAGLALYLIGLPLIALAGGLLGGPTGLVLSLAPAIGYILMLCIAGSLCSLTAGKPELARRTVPLFLINHVGYGLGFVAGLLGLAKGRPPKEADAKVMRMREFAPRETSRE